MTGAECAFSSGLMITARFGRGTLALTFNIVAGLTIGITALAVRLHVGIPGPTRRRSPTWPMPPPVMAASTPCSRHPSPLLLLAAASSSFQAGPGLPKALSRHPQRAGAGILPRSLGDTNHHHTPYRPVVVYLLTSAVVVPAAPAASGSWSCSTRQRRGRRRRGLHPPGQPPLRRPAAVECGDCSDRGHPLRAEARIGRPSGIEQAGRHLTTIMKRHEASRRRARQVPTRGGTPAASRAPGAREPAGEGTQVNRNALQSGPAASHGSEARGPPGWFTKPLCLLPPRGTTDRQVHADIKPRSRWWHSTHQRTLRVFVSQSNCTTASARQSRTVMAGKSGFMRHMLPPRAPASPGSASSPQPGSRMRCWCRSARILKTNSSRGQRPNCCPPSPRARRTDRGRGHSGRCKRPRAGHRRMWHRPGWAAPPISTMSRRRRAGALVPAPGLLTACSAAGSGR